jgi:7-cyano-7-deazaguanine synthase in queuosine biosynthesis
MFTVFIPEDRFGLFISGGFDSAVMLHLYCLGIKNNQQSTLNCITVDRGFAAVEFGAAICEWAENKHNIKINHMIVSIPEGLHHSKHVSYPAKQLFKFGFKTLISADTQNPPEELIGTGPTRIAPDAKFTGWHFPFSTLTKRETVKLAHDLGVLEEISTLSHSCTETDGDRCGNCWQCNERKWAFNELNLVDVGKF